MLHEEKDETMKKILRLKIRILILYFGLDMTVLLVSLGGIALIVGTKEEMTSSSICTIIGLSLLAIAQIATIFLQRLPKVRRRWKTINAIEKHGNPFPN